MHYTKGNILESTTEVIINPVNIVGVMGKGLALAFKKHFPHNYKVYKEACKNKTIDIGKLLLVDEFDLEKKQFIINFPTKKHWRNPSKIEYIEEGLKDLVRIIETQKFESMAIPALGCGLGGLEWEDVKLVLEKYLRDLEDIEILIFEPK
ncbi:putative phosphatase, C-terminal domain of histone macro H2A1 like protein [Bernardetia litoralis DSM 6794]|uniref:Putative phosphatase, C-terminal domain of histone macro H2A1 like protein n=1 Tax=Bernardetia litoralis (strain ATCC 23117 / DSM 6794 / NBRC 15988 / NCIMB 1366 / Fx l1 / Sio-4) TaxID=880071 RepID=I4AJ12_BERLS|nr:macro domain-containing protein [Bernardetia litoralis]AFM03947.1 putative phosphatase, C-terminal domain of histone macro H2A1 like protein [Bernardetia litoralis DSM 6794]